VTEIREESKLGTGVHTSEIESTYPVKAAGAGTCNIIEYSVNYIGAETESQGSITLTNTNSFFKNVRNAGPAAGFARAIQN